MLFWAAAALLADFSRRVSCQIFTPEIIRQIDLELIRTCGGECVNTFHDIFPVLTSPQKTQDMLDSIEKVFQTDLDEFKHKHRELQDLVATSFGKSKASKSNIRAHVNGGNPDGTACSSRADCDSLSKKLNMCSDMRIAALQTYEAVNKMVHALQAVLRLSCACLFEGPVTVCALAGFPYTCSVFYGGYQGLFSTSRGLYVLSGALVQTCSALSGLL